MADIKVGIIGGGPGGYVAAIRAAQLGCQVTLIEKDLVGGTCLNRGCIPTKAILGSIALLQKMREGESFGIAVGAIEPSFEAIISRKNEIVSKQREGVHFLLKNNGVEYIQGIARLTGPFTVNVDSIAGSEQLKFDRIIIATGSEPARLPFFDFDQPSVLTSTDALELTTMPETMLIVGGGVIGVEFATIFSELGCKLTIVEMMDQILPTEEKRIARQMQGVLRKKGIDIKVKTKVERIEEYGEGYLKAVLSDGSVIKAQKMLVSIGRQPNTVGIGLEEAGIETGQRGFIKVDKQTLSTNVKDHYTIGDVNGGLLLAHVASSEGITAAEICARGEAISKFDFDIVPNCIFTIPEVASVGLTEDAAKEKGRDVKVGRYSFGASGKAMAMGEASGFVQLVADARSDLLIGAQMMGPDVTDLIHEVALAISAKITVSEIGDTIHAHPTLSEAVMEAAHALHGKGIHTI